MLNSLQLTIFDVTPWSALSGSVSIPDFISFMRNKNSFGSRRRWIIISIVSQTTPPNSTMWNINADRRQRFVAPPDPVTATSRRLGAKCNADISQEDVSFPSRHKSQ